MTIMSSRDQEDRYYEYYEAIGTSALKNEYNRLADRVGDTMVDYTRRVIEDVLHSRGETV